MRRYCLILSLLLASFLFAAPSLTYAVAVPGNISTLSVNSSSIGLSFSGTSLQRYHFLLSVQLPSGLNPLNLTFGTPSTYRSITDYDFISYAGNTVTVDFFYLSDGSSFTLQLVNRDNSFDLSDSIVLSYGVFQVSNNVPPGNTMFIYDKVLALRQWTNTSHYLSSVTSDYAISTTSQRVQDTDTHYSLNSQSNTALTSATYDDFMGLQTSSGYFVSSVSLTSDGSIATGTGPVVNSYDVLSDASLTGGLRSTLGVDISIDEWGQFVDRVSTIGSLSLSSPNFNNFLPSSCYFPSVSSMSINPSSGYVFTNGFSPTYMTFVIDISSRPGSVSVSGCDLISWNYNSGRLTVECKKENATSDSTISLSSISISLSSLSSSLPLICLSNFCVGTFNIDSMISNMESSKTDNYLRQAFTNIQNSFNGLISSLLTGYNDDTSSALADLNDSNSEFSSSVSSYVQDEVALTSQANSYIEAFEPSSSLLSGFVPAFGLVSYVSETFYNSCGDFKYLITFILTLSCILFLLGIRRG